MGQRFGSPTGKAESGTEEEFNWVVEIHQQSGFPEIKWFFPRIEGDFHRLDIAGIDNDRAFEIPLSQIYVRLRVMLDEDTQKETRQG